MALDYSSPYSAHSATHRALQLDHAKRETALMTLGHKALSGADLPELFHQATLLITQTLQLSHSCIWRLLSDGSMFQLASSTGWSITPDDQGSEVIVQGDQQIRQLLESEHFIITDPNNSHALFNSFIPLSPPNVISSIVITIPGQDKPLGLLGAYHTEFRDFTPDDIQFLQVVAQVLATAIERKRSEALLQTQTQILESVASGSDLEQVFNNLCLLLEQQSPGALCSIMLVDESRQRLRNGSGPSLPRAYAEALDGLMIGEGVGSCGTAAYRGEAVFVTDVATDPLWSAFRDFALSYNIKACWSVPFFSQTGDLLGTFALSHCFPCKPTDHHLQIIRTATHLVSIAIEGHRFAEQLRQQALYDALTGLPNRVFLMEQLQQRFALIQRNRVDHLEDPAGVVVLFLDVDQFKLINDSLGHQVGDQLLIEIARRLQQCLDPQDIFARLGGDEFAILLNTGKAIYQAQQVASQIQVALSSPLQLEDHEVFASVSIGIAHSLEDYTDPQELLRDADTAMYRAKALGRERYVIFDKTMHTQALTRLRYEIDLRHAVEDLLADRPSQFYLYYQPIVLLSTGQIVGFEALLRWQHPEQGLVSPTNFIPVAEETGLIVPLGHWVLQQACQQLKTWQQQLRSYDLTNLTNLTMSVNVSSCQFLQPNFITQIEQVLQMTQLQTSCLKLEITETVLMETATSVTMQLERLQKLGINLSLDDFGTGYSSLSYLHHLPINTLKVDRSFVENLGNHQDKIVQTVITLAHSLEMDTVAEGVETTAQLEQLQSLGCEFGQGYLFSPPVSAAVAEQLLIAQQPLCEAIFSEAVPVKPYQ